MNTADWAEAVDWVSSHLAGPELDFYSALWDQGLILTTHYVITGSQRAKILSFIKRAVNISAVNRRYSIFSVS